jgi:hypothetical protein
VPAVRGGTVCAVPAQRHDSVVNTDRASRIRRALAAWRSAEAAVVTTLLTLAAELLAARQEHGGDDTAFSWWLIRNGLGEPSLSRHDRHALICMARYPAQARAVLEHTARRRVAMPSFTEDDVETFLELHSRGRQSGNAPRL